MDDHATRPGAPRDDDLYVRLWNPRVGPSGYADAAAERYRTAVLEQYKTYVEMADRVSSRRAVTNTFFLSLNSALVVGAAAVAGDRRGDLSPPVLLAGLLVLLVQCFTWFFMVRSYRQLNAAKYAVVAALERRLPALAYGEGEWLALGEGRDWRRYLPLTSVERWVPALFAVAYLVGFTALVV